MATSPRETAFDELCREAEACRVCPRLAEKKAVLSRLNGTLKPRVLFIGEAPGRRGAERTRRPFTGDVSGERFDQLLTAARLTRDEIFITNAVLCCPADEQRNRTPLTSEMRNCQGFLERTIALLNPPIIAPVGGVALRAVSLLFDTPLKLAEVAGTTIRLDTRRLVPLYHPSPRVLNATRSFEQMQKDFAHLSRLVRRITS